MIIIDPKSITNLDNAQEIIGSLQIRLFEVETKLDDLTRSAEIADVTKQIHLMQSFIEAAQVCLNERLVMPDVPGEDLNCPNIIVEDDCKALSTKRS